jgi:hypothetical protein
MFGKMRNFAAGNRKQTVVTPAEYVQLKAFARYDGALLAVLWVASFACYVAGLAQPMWSMVAMVLMVVTPFFVCKRLGNFRDVGRNGIISLRRGWAYAIFVFFYAAVLLAVAQYIYFAYIDQGYLLSMFTKALTAPEVKQALQQAGLQQAMKDSLEQLGQLRPIDYALNVLTVNIVIGIVMGLPIALLMQRKRVES